jgi:hypothetical protein
MWAGWRRRFTKVDAVRDFAKFFLASVTIFALHTFVIVCSELTQTLSILTLWHLLLSSSISSGGRRRW